MLTNQIEREVGEDVLATGSVVGDRYEIGELLAWGGMGIVYRARHLELGSEVAVKMMRRELVNDDDAYERFVREARNAAKLTTNHVAKVFDFGRTESGRPYLVMELLQGEPVSKRLERGPMTNEESARYLVHACIALGDAHSRGIVHRDLKPDNLFLTETSDGGCELKVLDFGIAKSLAPVDRSLTALGAGIGSPNYMAPEQMRSRRDLDQRADIWALGAVAYELLAGEPAFDGESITEICAKVLTEDPRPLRLLREDVWPELEAVIARCLERDPAKRFQTVLEVSHALQEALDSHHPEGAPGLVVEPLPVAAVRELEVGGKVDCTAATEVNLDISMELAQIHGLRARRWPKRLGWVSAGALIAAGVWVWWVGMGQLTTYASHRYQTAFSPAIVEPDDRLGRDALIVHAGVLVEVSPPAVASDALVVPIPPILKKKWKSPSEAVHLESDASLPEVPDDEPVFAESARPD